MRIYTVHQAKSQLSKLIQKALHGEEVIIANRKRPVVRLLAVRDSKRTLGFLGKGVRIDKDFDKPLADFRDFQ